MANIGDFEGFALGVYLYLRVIILTSSLVLWDSLKRPCWCLSDATKDPFASILFRTVTLYDFI